MWSDEDRHTLVRIAESLEDIVQLLNRQFNQRSVAIMGVPTGPLTVGETFSPVATAQNNGVTVPDAVVSWTIDNPAVLGVQDTGSGGGIGGALCTALADGSFVLTAVATNPDGSTVNTGPNNPLSGSVVTPVPTLATDVAIS